MGLLTRRRRWQTDFFTGNGLLPPPVLLAHLSGWVGVDRGGGCGWWVFQSDILLGPEETSTTDGFLSLEPPFVGVEGGGPGSGAGFFWQAVPDRPYRKPREAVDWEQWAVGSGLVWWVVVGFRVCLLFENCTVDASIFVVKLSRADGGCLGTRSR